MTKERFVRDNAGYLPWLRATAFAGVTAVLLLGMPFYSKPVIALAAVGVGALAFASPSLAALLFVGIASLPVLAANFVVGVLFLILGFSATQYLGVDQAKGFLTIMLAAIAIPFHAEWAVVVLAGYLLGSGQGAVAAMIACLLLQTAGAVLGLHDLGSVIAGGVSPGILSFGAAPDAPFAFGWLAPSIAKADPSGVLSSITAARPVAVLVAQPLIWGLGAVLGGVFRRPHETRARFATVAGIGGITVVLSVASALALTALGGSPPLRVLFTTGVVSTVAAAFIAAVCEWVFALGTPQDAAPSGAPAHGVRAEDADVDELLRMISSAEDALATRHTSSAVVMLTDMKAFSRMTEEVGSMASAKLVQRQRDLLLPIIDQHRGHGKSTGGDGLVAAFERPDDAVAAAIAMQRALMSFGEAHVSIESPAIRIGIAQGEVVLDKGGRPFIGAALNLAARVMDLADGGRIMVTGETADAAGLGTDVVHGHGTFELKNIQKPVRVTEVLWNEGQQPQDVRNA
jgi:class 3 adenylate cyclase